jgi:ABC-2 type transport system ATP-binding protein
MNENSFIVSLKNVTKKYKTTIAINNLSINIPKNQITALIGPNGAGKTTTLKIITGFIKNFEGHIVKNFKSFSYIPEEKLLYNNYTVEKILKYTKLFTLQKKGKYNHEIEKRLLSIFKIKPSTQFRDLSFGQKSGLYIILTFARTNDFYNS